MGQTEDLVDCTVSNMQHGWVILDGKREKHDDFELWVYMFLCPTCETIKRWQVKK